MLTCDNIRALLTSIDSLEEYVTIVKDFVMRISSTKRSCVSALCTGTVLIVAGDITINTDTLKTVEVLDTKTQ